MTQAKQKPSNIGRGLTIAMATAAAISASPVQANDIGDDVGHFIDCFGWMLTDPPTQYANCGVGTVPNSLATLATPVDGPVLISTGGASGGSGGSSGSGGSGTGGSGTGS